MKLVSFERNGRAGFGAVIDGGVVDLGAALNGRHADLMALLAADALGEARTALADRAADFALDSVVLLPVIPAPGKIWCCGLNYGEHVRETNREITEQPTFFLRVADSQVGHGQAIVRPPESVQLDYEAEIAVIIGKPGRRIAEADVWDHIAGYSCYNDGSVRDWQRHTSQWGPGKNFWRTGGFGPWMVTTDQIPARTVMTLVTRLNGQEMQRATTEMMIHSIERQIAYVSTIAPLQAGDVIVTGTPGGVGARRTPPVWMKPGDVVEIEVDRVGVLRNTIADDA
ncbi:MAG: 5-carboxymethyl-2-hydroxymuconate isomerase [Burkholderiales bacterium RIFCSPHIGHO2_12_FULL_69_20]|nr:MAG: 5-carboxymethyl-2-hydroxymuconate isomerase [Burkholderiales bacterium RIFCSPHIGHO2_12_FULL_69_20]